MKLKLDENGNVVLKDGKPVYVTDSGQEVVIDGAELFQKVNTLTQQNETLSAAAEAAKKFEGIDAEKAKKALEFVASYEANKGKQDTDLEELKNGIIKQMEEKYAPTVAELEKLKSDLKAEKITAVFTGSAYLKDKTTLPADFAEAYFSKHFSYEDGKVIPLNEKGEKLFSKTRAGELADSDEALAYHLGLHPKKDLFIKGSQADGGGFNGGNGGANTGATVSRDAFEQMSPKAQSDFFANGGTLTD